VNKLEIVYLNPCDLTPYENNTRKHAPSDIEGIKKSILADGFNDPIGVWGDNNLIVEGHGRQIAALELGLTEVPCIRLDHLTEEQRKEYAIRHNRSAELSAWDFSKLEEELASLDISGIDMSDLAFDLSQEDLFDSMSDSLVDRAEAPETFTVSFEFQIEEKGKMDEYLKQNGKQGLVNAILEVVDNA